MRNYSKTAKFFCVDCGIQISHNRKRCKPCDYLYQRAKRNDKTVLELKNTTHWQINSRIRADARAFYLDNVQDVKCSICGYDTHIEVCHIRAIKDFLDNERISDINSIQNLVGLCRNCHWELDNGVISVYVSE